jgi:murein DD-endopeptidase MepM/ murein hydrolase activator NlpD
MRAQNDAVTQLTGLKAELDVRADRLSAAEAEVAHQRAQAAQALAETRSLDARARAESARVAELVAQRQAARDAARRAQAADQARYRELVAERGRIQQVLRERAAARLAARRASARSRRGATPRILGGSGTGSGSSASLGWPAPGGVTSAYGMRRHPITGVYKLHDGMDIGAPCGTPVRASAAGQVVFADFNSAYGNRVIIDHGVRRGSDLATSYNHLTHYVVGPGQHVEAGQVVGHVGSTGYSTGCHLHFSVYVNGATTDPQGWL